MRVPRRRHPHVSADLLALALDVDETTHPKTGELVALARALRVHTPTSETRRAANKARMLRAAEIAFNAPPASTASGTQDLTDGPTGVHTAEVLLADGSRVVMADVEQISDSRAAVVAASVASGAEVAPEDL